MMHFKKNKGMKTNKIYSSAFLFLLFSTIVSCVSNKLGEGEISITETNYGLYKAVATGQIDNEQSATGKTNVAHNIGFYETTTNIPLTKGIQFGAEFIVNGKANQEVELEVVWTYPQKIKNNNEVEFSQYKSTSTRSTNDKTWTGYIINKDYEMVKGVWLLEIFYKNKKLYQKEFIVQ